MRQPSQKLIIFFIVALGAGYAVSFGIMTFILDAPLRLYGFGNLTLVALLVAGLLLIWFDKPMELGLFKWPAPKPKTEQTVQTVQRAASIDPAAQVDSPKGTMFPHETPTEHWDVNFGDSKQVYQGADLPVWILAGWAAFIIWAVVYLISGLPTFHY
ncbi:MAG: hypothetical protein L6R45_25675 [Anaerolineae bacterium]|nr:hypothetical protein [Anaerolineae bacterium]